jgi:hypothetical protein
LSHLLIAGFEVRGFVVAVPPSQGREGRSFALPNLNEGINIYFRARNSSSPSFLALDKLPPQATADATSNGWTGLGLTIDTLSNDIQRCHGHAWEGR